MSNQRREAYLQWSRSQNKNRFMEDENGRITKVEKRLDRSLLPIYTVLSTLTDPHLPKILSVKESDGNSIIVLEEYLEGETLQEWLETRGTLSPSDAMRCFEDIAQALHVIHSLNPPIIHRDVKPSNIIRNSAGRYVLIDFDAARGFDDIKKRDTQIMLTPSYAAPEQYGFCQTECRSDIFSLGATIYEMITGAPFKQGSTEIEGGLGRIITKCTNFSIKALSERSPAYQGAKPAAKKPSPLNSNHRLHRHIAFGHCLLGSQLRKNTRKAV